MTLVAFQLAAWLPLASMGASASADMAVSCTVVRSDTPAAPVVEYAPMVAVELEDGWRFVEEGEAEGETYLVETITY